MCWRSNFWEAVSRPTSRARLHLAKVRNKTALILVLLPATPPQPQTLRMHVNNRRRDAWEELGGACGRMRLCNHASGRHRLTTALQRHKSDRSRQHIKTRATPNEKHSAEKSTAPCAINSLCTLLGSYSVVLPLICPFWNLCDCLVPHVASIAAGLHQYAR